jgi:protein-tyrosine phosphatase
MKWALKRYGYRPYAHYIKKLNRKHLREYDLIVCMDRDNRESTVSLAQDAAQINKVRLLRDYDPQGPGNIPDPYYDFDNAFLSVVYGIEMCVNVLLHHIGRHEKV